MIVQKYYNAIDAAKLLMAFLVVCIHVGAMGDYDYSPTLHFILNIAIPFFFIASGFFIENKIEKDDTDEQAVYNHSLLKNLKLYALWILIYSPIALYVYFTDGFPWYHNLLTYLRGVLLVGETPYSWPLWFLLALIVAVFLIKLCREFFHWKLETIWCVAVLIMLMGYFINLAKDSQSYPLQLLYLLFEMTLGGVERNGIFMGFAVVTTGMLIRKYAPRISHNFLLGAGTLLAAYLLFFFQLPFVALLSGAGAVLMANSFQLRGKINYQNIRFYSTLVYFMHMLVLVLFFKFTSLLQGLPFGLAALISFATVLICAILLRHLSHHPCGRWINYLVGK